MWLTTLPACGLDQIRPGTHRVRNTPALLLLLEAGCNEARLQNIFVAARVISKKNYALQVGCGAITQALHKLLLLAPRFARRPWCRPTDRRFVDLYYEHLREQPL